MSERWRLRHNSGFDGLRAIAVVLVILVHTWNSFVPGGTIGVYMFFTLSGFLITALLLTEVDRTERVSFKNFYLRRALRLLPALFAVVAVVVVASHITGVDKKVIGYTAPSALFYYANWQSATGDKMGMLGHTWSLSVEEQFYLIWPITFWVGWKLGKAKGVLTAALIGCAASLVSHDVLRLLGATTARVNNGFDTQSVSMFVGCSLAASLFLGWRPTRRQVWPAALIGTGVIVLTAMWAKARVWSSASTWGLAILAMSTAALITLIEWWPQGRTARWLGVGPVAYIGRISYGIYLWHFPIVQAVARNLHYQQSYKAFLTVVAITLPVATVSYYGLERPFLRLKDRFRSGLPPTEPVDAEPQREPEPEPEPEPVAAPIVSG
ncbi:MAG: acyltransferase family protein [Acidimicrobiales bacterium]